MADKRIVDLPLATGPTSPMPSDVIALDGAGSGTRKVAFSGIADTINPPASQAEAEAGTDAVKRMTPLTTAQAIAVQAATAAQGALASTALQPSDIGTGAGNVAAGNDSRIVGAVQKTDFSLPGASPWVAASGFQWTKTIFLPDNTNLNSVLVAGKYDVFNPVNGPSGMTGVLYLDVDTYRDSGYRMQRVYSANDPDRVVSWERPVVNGTFGPWSPIVTKMWRTIENYGGVMGDSTTDYSTAFKKMLVSNLPFVIPSAMRIASLVTASRVSDGMNSLVMQGFNNAGSIILGSATAGIQIDIGNIVDSDTTCVVMRDLMIKPNAVINANAAVRLQGSGGLGVTECTADISNVHIRPTTTSNYAIQGWSLNDMRLSKMRNCTVRGANSTPSGSVGFLYFGSNQIPVESTFQDCISYFAETHFSAAGQYEGLSFVNCHAIAGKTGYKIRSVNPNLADKIMIMGCQANTSFVGMDLENLKNSVISDNLITGNAGWGTDGSAYYGIYSRVTQGAAQTTNYKFNVFDGLAIKSSVGVCNAFDIDGFSSGSLGSRVQGNEYLGFKIAKNIRSNTRAVVFDSSEQAFAVDTVVSNAAAGQNSTLPAPAAL